MDPKNDTVCVAEDPPLLPWSGVIDDLDSRFEDAQNDTSVNTKTAAVSITTADQAKIEMVQFENDYKISTIVTASNRKERLHY